LELTESYNARVNVSGKINIPVVSIGDLVRMKKKNFDKETLKHWKHTSTKAKLDWLSDALEFSALGKRT